MITGVHRGRICIGTARLREILWWRARAVFEQTSTIESRRTTRRGAKHYEIFYFFFLQRPSRKVSVAVRLRARLSLIRRVVSNLETHWHWNHLKLVPWNVLDKWHTGIILRWRSSVLEKIVFSGASKSLLTVVGRSLDRAPMGDVPSLSRKFFHFEIIMHKVSNCNSHANLTSSSAFFFRHSPSELLRGRSAFLSSHLLVPFHSNHWLLTRHECNFHVKVWTSTVPLHRISSSFPALLDRRFQSNAEPSECSSLITF